MYNEGGNFTKPINYISTPLYKRGVTHKGDHVLLINLPELTDLPHKPFPPLSLQVLRDSLNTIGVRGECSDLASYGPRIAERLTYDEFTQLFRANTEYGVVSDEDAKGLDLPVECLDAVEKSGLIARFTELVLEQNPALVGLSIPGTPLSSDLFAAGLCKLLARTLKAIRPDIPVVIGGARTIEKENVCDELLLEPTIDYLVRGNGYRSIRELAGGLIFGRLDLTDVRGLIYLENNKSRSNESDAPWGHLAVPIWLDQDAIPHYTRTIADLFPQARHISELDGKLQQETCFIPFQFTIGCVSECAFCNRASESGKISKPEEVVDYIEAAIKHYGIREFMFLNSEINFGRTYVHRFCKGLISRKLNINWIDSCEFRGLDVETLQIMRESGCIALWFGLETTSDRLLRYINKRTTVDHATSMLYESDRLGIYNCLNIICGFPYEREEDVQSTLSYLKDHQEIIDTTQVNVFYLQGGPFFDTPERFALRLRGYQEQVGETMCRAFDEVEGGLQWEDKKQQMLSSYRRVGALDDQLFPEASRDMPLVMALHKAFGGDKQLIQRTILRMADDPSLGNFIECPNKVIHHEGVNYLIDPLNQKVMQINDVVARCHELRHLKIWSHIRTRLLDQFPKNEVDAALNAIENLERNSFFQSRRQKPFRNPTS